MTTSPKPYDSLWEYLRDVALAFVIIIAGFLLAGVIAEPFRDLTDMAYPIGLCIGLAPFWWFTRRCQIHSFDWYDYAALSAFTLLAALLRSAVVGANQPMLEALIVAVAFGGFLGGWGWIRRKLRRESGDRRTT